MSLPYEILDAVTKLVGKEDHDGAALKVLSLASPTFRDLCQRLLFQSIKLYVRSYAGIYDPAKTPAYLVRFHHVVTQSPRIASYVRELNIAQYSVCPSGGHFQSAMWMLDHPDLLIGILHALRSSRVHAISIVSRGGVEWTKLDDRLQRSFLHIFQNSCFKSISLRGIRIPGHFFSAFKSLHSVELFNPTFPPGTNDVPPSTHTHQISHLAFRAHPHNNINSPRNNDFHLVGPSSRLVGPIIGLDLSQLTSLELDTNLEKNALSRDLQATPSKPPLSRKNLHYTILLKNANGQNLYGLSQPYSDEVS
ncbi:hypothetical protein BDN72DRAFT_898013 [Pluteus cervinus]|uniref:Uncharacterized protein n=1 Tax=Pluteus cervinus TaxID=181527 RepID=A0ACD3AUG6_9AGAR|nr:hypothetical protein BDN72DRAFT_898013 [Pluteus cervinus]